MYKNSGHLKSSIGTKSPAYILKRNAVGYKIMDPKSENEERIKRAVELHEINRQILRKTKLFDKDIQESLSLYLRNELDADRIIIHDDSLLIDVKIGKKLLTKDIIKIEKLTGYTFERMSGNDRYIFDKGHYEMGKIVLVKNWPDELKKVQDYIRDGKYD